FQWQHIRDFDYDALLSRFANPLELRRTDFHNYPIFGFVLTQTKDLAELDWALRSDLREFITTD
ncbi:MAG: ATP-grasp domain-containing protein, partial [Myxococcales bacterium]|nr:ATP-grasp domain-containing protein [Myxococcales bacterium]